MGCTKEVVQRGCDEMNIPLKTTDKFVECPVPTISVLSPKCGKLTALKTFKYVRKLSIKNVITIYYKYK